MPIELKMPALSPTMEEGTLAKWLVKEGDDVKSGDILAEIETDKATMEFEAVDEGKIAKILVPEGTDGVKVGAPIAIIGRRRRRASTRPRAQARYRGAGGAEAAAAGAEARRDSRKPAPPGKAPVETPPAPRSGAQPRCAPAAERATGSRRRRSRKRLAQAQNIDLSSLQGSGPGGRIVRADIDAAVGKAPAAAPSWQPRLPRRALGTHLVTARRRSSRRSRTRRSSSPTSARRSRAA